MRTLYQTDFVAWADETAKLLRQHRFEEIDLDALVEEVEGLAKQDRKAMRSQLQRLLIHLLKWHYLPIDVPRTVPLAHREDFRRRLAAPKRELIGEKAAP